MSIATTQSERDEPLPGDQLIEPAKLNTTHAISIQTPVECVWPWLVQIGQGRGGLYSYTWIENLIGCRMKNAERVHTEWQALAIGDAISLHPKAPPLVVDSVEINQHLVLRSTAGFPWSWSFVLVPNELGCRLLVRTRVGWSNALFGMVLWPIMGPGHYVMERKMLHGLRTRAKRVQQG